MRNLHLVGAALIAATVSFAPDASAVVARSYVSVTGNDSNTATNCPIDNPCRSLTSAYSVTGGVGEITILTSGNYGTLTVTRPMTVTAAVGVAASISVSSGGVGITVNTAGPTDVVVLRNLIFTGRGAAVSATGINHLSGRLVVEDSSFTGLGVGIESVQKLAIIDSNFYNNGVGLRVTGVGTDAGGTPSMNACTACAIVNRGNFVSNTTALSSISVGSGKYNILIRSAGNNDFLSNFVFNTTYMNNPDNPGTGPTYIDGSRNMAP